MQFRFLIRNYFIDSEHNCDQCAVVLEELENIDDDCDKHGIKFVKTEVSLINFLIAKLIIKKKIVAAM